MNRFYVFILLGFTLLGCATSSPKQMILRQVDQHTLLPTDTFLIKDDLHIQYTLDNKQFYLVADLDKAQRQENFSWATFSVRREREVFPLTPPKPVYLLPGTGEDLIRQTILPLVPLKTGRGILLFMEQYETVLVRLEDGSADLVPLAQLDEDVEIIGRIEAPTFLELLKEELKKQVSQQGNQGTRFLIRLSDVPQTPFVYFDTQKNISVQLQLPDYYKVKTEMSKLGFSGTVIYSFFVKSHLWSALKAPFTTAHRLESALSATVYSSVHPPVSDLKTVPPLANNEPMDQVSFDAWLNKHISKQIYPARVKLFINGEEFFPQLLLALQQAKEHIFFRLYIFRADPYGLSIADNLKKKANEGVDVRVVLDEINVVFASDKRPELKTREDFVQPRTIKKYLKKNSSVKVRTHLNPWSTFDHGKVILIDHRLAFTGGMNIGQEYRYMWHDMMISLEGPVVDRLVKNFYKNWSFSGWGGDYAAFYRQIFSRRHREQNKATPDMVPVRLLYTRPNDSEIFEAQREAIRRARQRVYMENPYFSDDRLMKELILARGRGVDVRVVFPSKNNVGMMGTSNRYFANKLIKNGVRVYFYPGMTHIKAGLFDNYAVVGSANMDKMSLYVNREMSVGVSDPAFIRDIETRLFEKDFEISEELTKPLQNSWLQGVITSLATQL